VNILAKENKQNGFLYIEGYLQTRFANNSNPKSITFILSPEPYSYISYRDAQNYNIKFDQLQYGHKIEGIQTKIIPNCGISFISENKQSIITEYFDRIYVLYNTQKNVSELSIYVQGSSLGRDFRSRYKQESEFYPILEKI
jgi:hypothetical protein